tara:strand:+ start:118 stop:570 length:453 start_codon:yes stop_codon:yes gene_type:complete
MKTEHSELFIKRQFAEAAIHTAMKAFADEQGNFPEAYEFNKNLSYFDGKVDSTEWMEINYKGLFEDREFAFDNFTPRGMFHWIGPNVAELSLVCEYFREIGLHYHVFWDMTEMTDKDKYNKDDGDWMVWTPTMEDWDEWFDKVYGHRVNN